MPKPFGVHGYFLQSALPSLRNFVLSCQVQEERNIQRKVQPLDDLLDILHCASLGAENALFLPFRLRTQSDDCLPDGPSQSGSSLPHPAVLRNQPNHHDIAHRREEPTPVSARSRVAHEAQRIQTCGPFQAERVEAVGSVVQCAGQQMIY